jgi:hypothetical protein
MLSRHVMHTDSSRPAELVKLLTLVGRNGMPGSVVAWLPHPGKPHEIKKKHCHRPSSCLQMRQVGGGHLRGLCLLGEDWPPGANVSISACSLLSSTSMAALMVEALQPAV